MTHHAAATATGVVRRGAAGRSPTGSPPRPAPASRSRPTSAPGTSTSVDAYEGEIESLTQAGSAGIGIRVIEDGRTGFAWATSHDDDIVAETLAEARDNRPFAEPDEFAGMAEPDGVAADAARRLPRRGAHRRRSTTRWPWPSNSSGWCAAPTRG